MATLQDVLKENKELQKKQNTTTVAPIGNPASPYNKAVQTGNPNVQAGRQKISVTPTAQKQTYTTPLQAQTAASKKAVDLVGNAIGSGASQTVQMGSSLLKGVPKVAETGARIVNNVFGDAPVSPMTAKLTPSEIDDNSFTNQLARALKSEDRAKQTIGVLANGLLGYENEQQTVELPKTEQDVTKNRFRNIANKELIAQGETPVRQITEWSDPWSDALSQNVENVQDFGQRYNQAVRPITDYLDKAVEGINNFTETNFAQNLNPTEQFVTQAIGGALPNLARNLLLGALSGGSQPVLRVLSDAAMFIPSFYEGLVDGQAKGLSEEEAMLNAIVRGSIETGTEQMFDFWKLTGGGMGLDEFLIDLIAMSNASPFLKSFIKNATSTLLESSEDVASSFLNSLADTGFYGQELNLKDMTTGMLQEGAASAMSTFVIGLLTGQFSSNSFRNFQAYSDYLKNKTNDKLDIYDDSQKFKTETALLYASMNDEEKAQLLAQTQQEMAKRFGADDDIARMDLQELKDYADRAAEKQIMGLTEEQYAAYIDDMNGTSEPVATVTVKGQPYDVYEYLGVRTPDQDRAMDIAERLGVKAYIVEDLPGGQNAQKMGDGTILISANAKRPAKALIFHEIFHKLRSDGTWNELLDLAFTNMTKEVGYERYVEDMVAKYVPYYGSVDDNYLKGVALSKESTEKKKTKIHDYLVKQGVNQYYADPNFHNMIDEEIAAEFLERFNNEDTIKAMYNRSGNVFERMWQDLKDSVQNFTGVLTKEEQDLKKAERLFAKVAQEEAEAQERFNAEPVYSVDENRQYYNERFTDRDGRVFINDLSMLSNNDWKTIQKAVDKLGYGLGSAEAAREAFSRYVPEFGFNTEQSNAIRKAFGVEESEKKQGNIGRANLAKVAFGTTGNFNEAGYLLQDGKMLDFSGKREGGSPNQRAMDHRDISRVFDEELGNGSSATAYMNKFIDEGNIRLMPEQGVTIGEQEPTSAQYAVLKRFVEHMLDNEGFFYLDIQNENGNTIADREYGKGDKSSRIINDIKAYFKDGELPYRSQFADFRYSLSPDFAQQYMDAVNRNDMATAESIRREWAEQQGYDRESYHGTMNGGFTVFDKQYANPEGNSGAGFYSTTDFDDANDHYRDAEGADNYFKRSNLAEQILDAGEWNGEPVEDYDEAYRIATDELNKNPQLYELMFRTENPYIRDFRDSTDIGESFMSDMHDLTDSEVDRADYDNDEDYDEAYYDTLFENVGEEVDTIVRNAVNDLENNYEYVSLSPDEVDAISSAITFDLADYGRLTWDTIYDAVQRSANEIEVLRSNNEQSEMADAELTRAIIEGFGYDSIIDREVDRKFNQVTASPGTEHYIAFNPSQYKLSDTVTYDDNGNVIPIDQRYNRNNSDIRYSLDAVEPIQPTSDAWRRDHTTDEVKAMYPGLWNVAAEESEERNPTQVTNTVNSYRKIYDYLRNEGFNGTILDASSGLGLGTQLGRNEYGYDVDDIEPYPDKNYHPRYTDYSTLNKTYDAIISNAVLNVLPQDQRDALVVKMGQMLNPGGKMFVNVRGKDVLNASSKKIINPDNMEVYISNTGSYQKGFTPKELRAYLKDALGDGYTVEPTKLLHGVAAIVTKNGNERYSLDVGDNHLYQYNSFMGDDIRPFIDGMMDMPQESDDVNEWLTNNETQVKKNLKKLVDKSFRDIEKINLKNVKGSKAKIVNALYEAGRGGRELDIHTLRAILEQNPVTATQEMYPGESTARRRVNAASAFTEALMKNLGFDGFYDSEHDRVMARDSVGSPKAVSLEDYRDMVERGENLEERTQRIDREDANQEYTDEDIQRQIIEDSMNLNAETPQQREDTVNALAEAMQNEYIPESIDQANKYPDRRYQQTKSDMRVLGDIDRENNNTEDPERTQDIRPETFIPPFESSGIKSYDEMFEEGHEERTPDEEELKFYQSINDKMEKGKGGNSAGGAIGFLTPEQYFDHAVGRNTAERKILDDKFGRPMFDAKKGYTQNMRKQHDGLKQIVEETGIYGGTDESAAVQWYGEGQKPIGDNQVEPYTLDDLKRDFPEKWEDIVKMEQYMRKQYDEYVERWNAILTQIYPHPERMLLRNLNSWRQQLDKLRSELELTDPNDIALVEDYRKDIAKLEQKIADGEDAYRSGDYLRNKRLIPRKDYFHHIREVETNGFGNVKNILQAITQATGKGNIDPDLVDVSQYTQPRTKWSGLLQHRNSNEYTADAVTSFARYVNEAEYAIAMNPVISQYRDEISKIRKATKQTKNANTMIDYLAKYTNDLAGKTNYLDTAMREFLGGEGNRNALLTAVEAINRRGKANAVVGNLRSAIAQFYNIPNALSVIKSLPAWRKGFNDYMAAKAGNRELLDQSPFLAERYGGLNEKDFQARDTVWKQIEGKLSDFSSKMMEFGDREATELIWLSAYNEGLEKGVDDPVYYADSMARRAVGGRGIGEVPFGMNSRLVGLFAPFQVEANNQWQNLKGMIEDKDAEGIFRLMLGSYLMNILARAIFNNGVLPDPLEALEEGIRRLLAKDREDSVGQIMGDTAKRVAGETVSMIPGTSLWLPLVMGDNAETFFGDSDPTRYGTGTVGVKNLFDVAADAINGDGFDAVTPLLNLGLPYGGKQVSRMYNTLQDLNVLPSNGFMNTPFGGEKNPTAGSYSNAGALRYQLPNEVNSAQDIVEIARALAFGSNSTDAAQEYFDNGNKPLLSKERVAKLREHPEVSAENYIQYIKEAGVDDKQGISQQEAYDWLSSHNLSDEERNALWEMTSNSWKKSYDEYVPKADEDTQKKEEESKPSEEPKEQNKKSGNPTTKKEFTAVADSDGNGSLKQAEAYAWLNDQKLSDAEKAALWELMGWKTDYATYASKH